jgi:hypothetical protein
MTESSVAGEYFEHLVAYALAICKECRHGVLPSVGTEKRREKVHSYRMRSEGSIYMSGVSGAFQISGVTWNDDMVEHSGSY